MKKVFLGLIILLALQACSRKLDVNFVANTKWVLSEWPDRTMPVNAQATLSFDGDAKIGGKSFCNAYGGNSVITKDAIKFEQIFSTKMFCSEFSQAENNYQADLLTITSAKISGNKLSLFKNGQLAMVFVRTQ